MVRIRGNEGFSLLEMLVTITIIGVLAAFALPAYKDWMASSSYKEAASDLVSQFRIARDSAVSQSSQQLVTVTMGPQQGEVVYKWDEFTSAPSGTIACTKNSALNIYFSPNGSVLWDPTSGASSLGICVEDSSGNTRFGVVFPSQASGRALIQ